MKFITVSCGYDQSYSVSEDVLRQLIQQCANNTKFLKLEGMPRIELNKDNSNASFIIDVKIKKNKSLSEVIDNFIKDFETRFVSLIDIKPQDIRICFSGSY
ncbi:hypothetical protein MCAL160_0191 [Mycoplasmopsis californica HAZ160_1]|uniref:Uncharacterized protein n=2 Tax=Mycoplasmopsis californica TaxID=2113 RepID=A0A059XRM4_9BACT|nr:hypothetical protein [Mycoplasmopsis californica]AIA29680.1 hypothetical protein MCFN_02810 [Mycoplasmopsis californica]BAP00890.1 hypothetical protein MCAL160_0191 [Mycoplasmopsis californica HAZ160_1]BBG40749.1 hypothetical protein MCAL106_0191 [Mycoplasmopsis californica]BBG41343.1 hypothetical protein MCAL106E_0191 [Mycoplasmopsis californica]BBG41936.1 hypothetical protein MCAL106L_0191 [Mycoplasmopsis californica]